MATQKQQAHSSRNKASQSGSLLYNINFNLQACEHEALAGYFTQVGMEGEKELVINHLEQVYV
jgi:hypothetical protein